MTDIKNKNKLIKLISECGSAFNRSLIYLEILVAPTFLDTENPKQCFTTNIILK